MKNITRKGSYNGSSGHSVLGKYLGKNIDSQ